MVEKFFGAVVLARYWAAKIDIIKQIDIID